MMRVELKIDRRDSEKLPDDGIHQIEAELKRRIASRYAGTDVYVRIASANELSITKAQKEAEKAIRKLVEDMFSEADEWMITEL